MRASGLAGAALLATLASLALGASWAAASSYGGSGDWTITALANEVDTGETISVSGNLTVIGSLTLVNSTLTVDRNVSVVGTLVLRNSTLRFTVDGPGTNSLSAQFGAAVSLLDYDGSAATTQDASVLTADAYGFAGTWGFNSTLNITNSRVERAGWVLGNATGTGFAMANPRLTLRGASFTGGGQAFGIGYVGTGQPLSVTDTTFDGMVSAMWVEGGVGHSFLRVHLANYTFGLRLNLTATVTVEDVDARLALGGFEPFGAPPAGTAVALESADNISVLNLSIVGTPGSPGPRYLTGLVAGNTTGLTVRGLSGSWGDLPAQLFQASDVLISGVDISYFTTPFTAIGCRNVTLLSFRGVGESAGFQATSTSGLVVRGFVADGLLITALSALGASGVFDFEGAVISNSVGGVNLGGNATAPRFVNVTFVNVTFGVQMTSGDPTGTRFEAFVARTVLRTLIDLTFGTGTSLTAVDFDVDDVQGVALNITGSALSQANFGRMRFNATEDDAVRLNVSRLDNVSFYSVQGFRHLGALLHINSSQGNDIQLFDIFSNNSTGVIAVFDGGSFARVLASNLTLAFGDIPPALGPPAAVVMDASGAADGASPGSVGLTVRDLRVNTSNRGAVYIEAPLGGFLVADRLTLDTLQLEGVRVLAGNGSFAVTLRALAYNGTGAAAVRLENVAAATLSNITAAAASGVQLDYSWGVGIVDLWHAGAYAGLHATGGGNVTLRAANSTGTFGVDASQVAGLDVRALITRADGWALRAAYSSDVTVDGLEATASAGGVALLGVARAALSNLTIEFRVDGLVVGQGATDIALRTAFLRSAPALTARTALDISFSTRVAVAGVSFTGACEQAAELRSVVSLDLAAFSAATCGRGVDIAGARFLSIIDLHVAGAFNGSALSMGATQDVLVLRANLSFARLEGLLVDGVDRARFNDIDASFAGGDGALLAFAANTSFDRLKLSNAAGTGMHILYCSRNVTLSNVEASFALAGIELIVSPNVTLVNVSASNNLGTGVYTDAQSGGVTLRNITASLNRGNGVQVYRNGTRLIDGNFSRNGDPGFAAAPNIRLDWRIEGEASLTEENVDLTGDLLIGPGAALTLTRSSITVDQTARRKALDPYAQVVIEAGASLTLDSSNLTARDGRVPFSVLALASARVILRSALLEGGGTTDATSSINLTGAELHAVDATFRNWYAPASLDGGLLDCRECTFSFSRRGPDVRGGSVSLRALYARDLDLDGLAVTVSPLVIVEGATLQYNHGLGARFFGVDYLRLTAIDAFFNDLGGVEVLQSNLSGGGVAVNSSGAFGLRVAGGAQAVLDGLFATENAGAGASFEDVALVSLSSVQLERNHGSGLQLLRVAEARVGDGAVRGSTLYGLYAQDCDLVEVERVSFGGDEGASLRTEGITVVSVGNATLSTDADYAVTLFGTTRATLTNLVITAPAGGVLAAQSSSAFVLNSTMSEPTVVDEAVVTIAWYLRVLVQDADGYPAPGASINVTNATGGLVGTAATSSTGSFAELTVPEREVRAAGRETTFGPESVRAEHPTLGRAATEVNVTRFTALGLRLDNRTPTTAVLLDGELGPGGWFLSPVEVTLHAADEGAQDLSLHYRVGLLPWEVSKGTLGSATASFRLAGEGATTLEFYAVDDAGNTEPLRAQVVRIDTTAPTARFVALPPVVFEGTLHLEWSASDGPGSGPGLYRIEYALNGSAPVVWLNGTDQTSAVFEGRDGTYEFRLTAFDAAGLRSDTAVMTVRIALLGAFRIRVVDPSGNAVANATIEVVGGRTEENVSGAAIISGVPPGTLTLRIHAAGFETKTLAVVVAAGEVADLGDVPLTRASPPAGGVDLTLAYFVMAALLVLTLAYYIQMKAKWARRTKQRHEAAEAERKAEKARRRR